jgi:hypothetical protein
VKVYCKRTKFNQIDVDEKGYVKWKKDSWYEFEKPHGYESNYVYGHVSNNYGTYKESISKSDFDKYFYTTEDLRDFRINKILNI